MRIPLQIFVVIVVSLGVFLSVTAVQKSTEMRSYAQTCEPQETLCAMGMRKLIDGSYKDTDNVTYHPDGSITMPSGDKVGPGTSAIGFQDALGAYHVIFSTEGLDKKYTLKKPVKAYCASDDECSACKVSQDLLCKHQMREVPFNSGTHRLLPSMNYQKCYENRIACNYASEIMTADSIYSYNLIIEDEFDCSSLRVCFQSVIQTIYRWLNKVF